VPVLAGWGASHLSTFFAERARAALIVAFLLSFVVGISFRIEFNPFRSTGRKESPWPITLGALSLPVCYGLVAWLDHHGAFTFPDWPVLRWLGVGLFTGGDLIRLLALRELGTQYSALLTIQADHQLIETGIFRRIRHPFYLGQVLAEPGIMLALRSPLAILIVAASVPFVVRRMDREERILLDYFGETYRSYCARSWRLLPGVY
jgi:protein-S-isoprenylcysteine O-methyltransferase Ste14